METNDHQPNTTKQEEEHDSADNLAKQVKKDNVFALHSTISELCSENEYYDVTIQVGHQSFRSHRLLLAALSEYFHAMFGGNFKERHTNKDEPIVLHDIVDPEAFELILHFLYSGDVINITDSNVCAVLTSVDFLKLRNPACIETKCVELIREKIRGLELIPNVMKIFKFSCLTKRETLSDLLSKHIFQHLSQLSTKETFESISYEDLKELLQGYSLWMCNQDVVLNFLIGWVHQFHKERKRHFKELVKLVDLKKISTDCISFLLNEYEKCIDFSQNLKKKKTKTTKTSGTSFQLFAPLCLKDKAQSEITITFFKENFSALKEGDVSLSPACFIHDFSWRILIERKRKEATSCLWVYLRCDGHPEKKQWKCSAQFRLSILSQRKEHSTVVIGKSNGYEFDQKKNGGGWSTFHWDKIIDPKQPFIKDDIVVFQAHVIADLPQYV